MKLVLPIVVILTTILKDGLVQGQALFVKTDILAKVRQGSFRGYLPPPSNTQRPRPFEPVSPNTGLDFEGNYHQGYPPAGSITPQPPFPIYTNPTTGAVTGQGYLPPSNEITPPEPGYPSSPRPQPPFTEGPRPTTGPTGYPTRPPTGYPPSQTFPTQPPRYTTSEKPGFPTAPPPGYTTGYPRPTFPTQPPRYTTERPSTGFPTQRPPSTGYPTQPPITGFPTQRPSTGYPTQGPDFPTFPTQRPSTGYPTPQPPSTGYPTQRPPSTGYPTQPPVTGYPTQRPSTGYPTQGPDFPTFPTQRPSEETTRYPAYTTLPPTGYPTTEPVVTIGPSTGYPTQPPIIPGSSTHSPVTSSPSTEHFTSPAITTPESGGSATDITVPESTEDNNVVPTKDVSPTTIQPSGSTPSDEDLKHPPHIHAIDVQCAKDMMTITIEFNREFNGIIYSKGFYNNPECRYVNENSEQTKYKFTVSLNSCGTEFINAFDTQGQSYLENVLVLQNEPGIQEVWDTIRSVRCLWEGSLKESLSVALSVGMLSQEIVTFSGDTAMARLDIQLGRGPFAPSANGLVKIGEPMTLVVSVSGDPGFDVQVRDCRATDSTGGNVVPLTDDNGCVLKPKLFGAFQKTRNTGDSGASIIAYAFFNAFKFPDVMDLMIECNIELCKTDCQVCPEPNQKLEPGRRRRRRRDLLHTSSSYDNETIIGDPVTIGKHFRVILPEDLNEGSALVDLMSHQHQLVGEGVCMSTQNFVLSSAVLISLLTASSLFSACMWLKSQRLGMKA